MLTSKPGIQKAKPVYVDGFLKYCLFDGSRLPTTDWEMGHSNGTESYQIKCSSCGTVYNRFRDKRNVEDKGKTYYMRLHEKEMYWRCVACDTPAIEAKREVPVYSETPSVLLNRLKAMISEKDTEYLIYCPRCERDAVPAKLRKASH